MLDDVHGEGRFAHAGAGRQDDQLAGVQPSRFAIQFSEPVVGYAASVRAFHPCIEAIHGLDDDLVERDDLGVAPLVEDREDLVLRLYSVDGKFIRDLYSGKGDDAHTTIDCDLSGLRSGSYVLGASTFTRNEYHSIVILH